MMQASHYCTFFDTATFQLDHKKEFEMYLSEMLSRVRCLCPHRFLLWENITLVIEFQAWEYKIKQVMAFDYDRWKCWYFLNFHINIFFWECSLLRKEIKLILYPQGRNSKPVLKYFLFTIANVKIELFCI